MTWIFRLEPIVSVKWLWKSSLWRCCVCKKSIIKFSYICCRLMIVIEVYIDPWPWRVALPLGSLAKINRVFLSLCMLKESKDIRVVLVHRRSVFSKHKCWEMRVNSIAQIAVGIHYRHTIIIRFVLFAISRIHFGSFQLSAKTKDFISIEWKIHRVLVNGSM